MTEHLRYENEDPPEPPRQAKIEVFQPDAGWRPRIPILMDVSRSAGVNSIGAVADRTGLPVETIRFYETSGLLAPQRDRSGHRRYAEADISELEVIQALRQAGMSLKDIRDHLHPADDQPLARRSLAAALLRILDERGADLVRARVLVTRWAADRA